MFGMGFTEILLIGIIAILFLGPDKLPETMVQIGKFFNSFRRTINEAKSTFEEELHIKELREEALSYRQSLQQTADDISGFKNAVPNPARELEEALDVARSGMGNLDDADKLYDEEEQAPAQNDVTQYKAMARKALEEAQKSEELSSAAQAPDPAGESAEAPAAPRGFKNLDGGNPA